MGVALPVMMLGLAAMVMAHLLSHPPTDSAPRQIAYNMRLYHRAALSFKAANPAVTGILAVPPPVFLTEWRFISCADSKSVVTYGGGFTASQSRDIAAEAARQSVVPPELGLGNWRNGSATGIGLSDGTLINSGFSGLTPVCTVPSGVAAIQTRLLP